MLTSGLATKIHQQLRFLTNWLRLSKAHGNPAFWLDKPMICSSNLKANFQKVSCPVMKHKDLSSVLRAVNVSAGWLAGCSRVGSAVTSDLFTSSWAWLVWRAAPGRSDLVSVLWWRRVGQRALSAFPRTSNRETSVPLSEHPDPETGAGPQTTPRTGPAETGPPAAAEGTNTRPV